MTLGDKIRNKRLQLRLMQKEAAELLEVEEHSIYFWENNKVQPGITHHGKIIQFLGYYPFPLDLETLGGRIQCYLHLHGYSHDDFARLVGVDPGTVCRWKSNEKKPLKRSMPKVLECLKSVEPMIAMYTTEEGK